jgi:Rho GDP-dissociation inhibitor
LFDESDGRQVIIIDLQIQFKGRPEFDICIPLRTPEDVKRASETPLTFPEGLAYTQTVSYAVQRDLCMGLKYQNAVYKMGLPVDRQSRMIGSFAAGSKVLAFTFPEEVVPAGFVARGNYRAKCKFSDDDRNVHLEFEYGFSIKKVS